MEVCHPQSQSLVKWLQKILKSWNKRIEITLEYLKHNAKKKIKK